MKYLYLENYKILMQEIEDDTKRRKDHPGLAALPYSPHPHSGPRIHSRREAPASSSEAATSLIFCCPQMRSPVKLALSTPVPSSKHHPHPAAHSLSWSAHHRGTCSRLFFTALFSGLINIDGRAGSRVALLGDNLSGRRVSASGLREAAHTALNLK